MRKAVLSLSRAEKKAVAVGADVAMCAFSIWVTMAVRLERIAIPLEPFLFALAVGLAIALPLFVVNGLYRAIFRYSGWNATVAVVKALLWYWLLFTVAFAVISRPGIPRSVGVFQPLLFFVLVVGTRLAARVWLGGLYELWASKSMRPGVLVYGAGAAGRQLASVLAGKNSAVLQGFLDDDARLQGHQVDGRMVYAPSQLSELVERLGIRQVVLALPSISALQRRHILQTLRSYPVHVRTMPNLDDITAGKVRLEDLQELELEDLLWRDSVSADEQLLNQNIAGRVVLVTGAGGSIGSELCRQIIRLQPRKLLLIDASEFALYSINEELKQNDTEMVALLGSVTDAHWLDRIFATFSPDTVFHAAAYKHVPMVEHNVASGVRNNVWGTLMCAQAAALHGVRNFILVSTDKAVRPTNVMGASKRLAEMVLQALAARSSPSGTCFSMVRFGNVLGSSGSVVPLFRRQINEGGPVTLTHPEVTRYFMTIPEAAQLVLQAGAMAQGGEVFVLDMGESVRIKDLAVRMIELSGLSVKDESNPYGDIEIQVTGLRPGEKLFEELLIGNNPQRTLHPKIIRAQESFVEWNEVQHILGKLEKACATNDIAAIRLILQQSQLGYKPDSLNASDHLWLGELNNRTEAPLEKQLAA